VAVTSVLPLTSVLVRADFTIAGRPPADPSEIPSAQNRSISAGYFELMGIPILSGRAIGAEDRSGGRAVAVVDETLAKRWFPGADPIGAHLSMDDGGGFRDVEIVGVCGGVHLASLEEPPAPAIYVPFAQTPRAALGAFTSRMHLMVKTAPGTLGVEEGVRRAVLSVDRDVPISFAGTMDAIVEAAAAPRRFNRTLMEVFAGAGLLLSAAGLYALISAIVASRTRELGIRRALGARGVDVALGVVLPVLRLTVAGIAAGLAGALVLSRSMGSLLFGVRPFDLPTYATATALLASVALVACVYPAWRAACVDPAVALRAE
jgi:putative ABC transport system permease protein